MHGAGAVAGREEIPHVQEFFSVVRRTERWNWSQMCLGLLQQQQGRFGEHERVVPGKRHQVRSLRFLPGRREQRNPAGCCESACRLSKGRMICLRHTASSEALHRVFATWQLSSRQTRNALPERGCAFYSWVSLRAASGVIHVMSSQLTSAVEERSQPGDCGQQTKVSRSPGLPPCPRRLRIPQPRPPAVPTPAAHPAAPASRRAHAGCASRPPAAPDSSGKALNPGAARRRQ
uniref:Uncharacterized protein n=1 Tax=Rangifer tarandus platyrhynchus TaxID=3082113 RepID=A0ACB0ECC4_RANTA|nr:unnamed protein product [Rangifer tarandus platyrhynchus]